MNLLLMKDYEINSGYDPGLNSYMTITLSISNLVLTSSDHGNGETIADMIRIQYIRNFKLKHDDLKHDIMFREFDINKLNVITSL